MTTDEKRAFANEAERALDHPLVEHAIGQLLGNLQVEPGGLADYGIRKVATYAASVARAQALGIDPDALRQTDEEEVVSLARQAHGAVARGQRPIVLDAGDR